MKPRRYAATTLSLYAFILMGMGIFFVFGRPALLPEDARYLHMSTAQIEGTVPRLADWLDKVFWVTGGYIFSTGVLILCLARTWVRAPAWETWGVVAFTGLTSIGMMTVVNFLLVSDFRWLLLAVALIWTTALGLFVMKK